MKYCYLRDEKGNPMVTIAYETVGDNVFYGATAVSGEEELITKEKGKQKATLRCLNALDGKLSGWRDYHMLGEPTNKMRNGFVNILDSFGLCKVGCQPKEKFQESIKKLVKENRETPFRNQFDALESLSL